MSGAQKTKAEQGREKTNPYSEWLGPDEIEDLIQGFYGTRVLQFDRPTAEHMLRYNTGNRRVSKRKVDRLAQQMSSGEFENTGEPIIFSAEGVLNNGQHRLEAVVQSEAIVDMDVRFGIPRKAFTKTDTGTVRTGGDVLTIAGVSHGSQISQAVRLLILYERGLPESVRDFVSNDEIARGFERWSDITEATERVQAYNFPKGVKTTPLFAVAYLAARSSGKAKIGEWLETLSSGLTANKEHPAYQLRERLMRGMEAAAGSREGLIERFALMIKSWNLFRKGEHVPMRDFRWKASGKSAEPFPSVTGAKL